MENISPIKVLSTESGDPIFKIFKSLHFLPLSTVMTIKKIMQLVNDSLQTEKIWIAQHLVVGIIW
jgi:hypothetical protein